MSNETELRKLLEVWLTGVCPMSQHGCRVRDLCWHCFENMMVDLDLEPGSPPTCCHTCRRDWEVQARDRDVPFSVIVSRPMFVCPQCGDKRCPKAVNHYNLCQERQEQVLR